MRAFSLLLALGTLSTAFAHPMHYHKRGEELKVIARDGTVISARATNGTTSLDILKTGNQEFKAEIAASSNPQLLKTLTDDGQAPPFLFLGCSDSRVSEGTIFNAPPGTFFTARNIANQFHRADANTEATISYGVSVLGVEHIIVMGHYGCGGVAAAIASAPRAGIDAASGVVQAWIEPIRDIFLQSSRPEIVELRNRIANQTDVPEPEFEEPGFKALVEENVKAGVARIARDSVLVNHYDLLAKGAQAPIGRRAEATGPPKDVFVHGFIYDIEDGNVRDLGVSVGPPGKAIPPIPFDAVLKAADGIATPPANPPTEPSPSASTPSLTVSQNPSAASTSITIMATIV